MIRSYIGFTQEYRMILKLERSSHLSGRSFGLGSSIGLDVAFIESRLGKVLSKDRDRVSHIYTNTH